MLEITNEYAQKCYHFRKKRIAFNVAFLMDSDQAEIYRTIHEDTGMFIIYKNIGSRKFDFYYHGDKENFETLLSLANLQLPGELVEEEALRNEDNIEFGMERVLIIRNKIPVSRIRRAKHQDPFMQPDVKLDQPVIVTFYQPKLWKLELELGCGGSPYEMSDPSYVPPPQKIYSETTLLEFRMKAVLDVGEHDSEESPTPSSGDAPSPGWIKPGSLRSAVRAAGFKPENQKKSPEKPVDTLHENSETKSGRKSKHQGKA